mgnify:FL=1
MQQDQDIKGFTILELLVVIAIVAIISGVAYPSFSKWSTERKVRAATEKVASMISNIATQTQRGNLAYSQLMVQSFPNSKTQKSTIFVSKGMGDKNFKKNLEEGKINCPVSSSGYWDDFGRPIKKIGKSNFSDYYEIFNPIDKVIGESEIAVQFTSRSAICFGKGGNYYKATNALSKGSNINIVIEGRATPNYIVICTYENAKKHGNKCPVNGTNLKKPAYLVKWSRFGNVSKFKWNGSDWNRQ